VSRLKVAILTGGRSSEHEVALASARSIVAALDPERYETVAIEIGRDGRWALGSSPAGELGNGRPAGLLPQEGGSGSLPPSCGDAAETLPVPVRGATPALLGEVDVVFPVLHGPFGEDGSVQGLLELADVPYVGAGVTASGLCMDKDLMKAVLRDRDIPVTRNITLRPGDPLEHPYPYPVFVKPARLGSSVGITKARTRDELAAGVELAFRHDEKVLVEEFVDGVEVECGVIGNDRPEASVPGEIVAHADWYDYAAKYDDGGMELVIPPRIPDEAAERVRELSVASFVATGCEGMARVDCFVRTDGEVLINELNTIPGFTATSVYAKLFEASGVSYPQLLDRLIDLALERHRRRAKLQY
jgi:D-alanine-D-alanine ligase